MSMFDGFSLDDIGAKLGIAPEQANALAATLKDKIAAGGDVMASLQATAQEHGVSLDSLKSLLATGGEKGQDLFGKVGGMLDRDGDGNPLNDLGGMAKGLFGRD